MDASKRGVVLVGHGGIPKDCPREWVARLKQLESRRRGASLPPSAEELELDAKIRRWPRTAASDPYQSGLEALAAALQSRLNGACFAVAYNEYCAPTLEEAVAGLVERGANDIVVLTTMVTPGGSHAEIDIPEALDRLRRQHAHVALRYAWPFDLDSAADMLAEQVKRHMR